MFHYTYFLDKYHIHNNTFSFVFIIKPRRRIITWFVLTLQLQFSSLGSKKKKKNSLLCSNGTKEKRNELDNERIALPQMRMYHLIKLALIDSVLRLLIAFYYRLRSKRSPPPALARFSTTLNPGKLIRRRRNHFESE